MNPWLIMLMPYFGRWPAWIDFFIESCKWNPGVRWRFYTDCGEPENHADNVDYVHLHFDEYKAFVSERLGMAFAPADPYKLCDVRPCLGYLHEQDTAGFPFFGYGDIDVIYGNIDRFYTAELRETAQVLSTHPERVSGHFAVIRNCERFRQAFERIPNYRQLLAEQAYAGLDEGAIKSAFSLARGLHFEERYSTVLSPRGWHDGTMNYPARWLWRGGGLTNDRDGEREFLYLHFMRWHSGRWRSDRPAPGEAAWVGLEKIVHLDWRVAGAEGFGISASGFTPYETGPSRIRKRRAL